MHSQSVCSICLEEGATEPAPCGFLHALFHKACLLQLADSGCTNCPHCNQTVPSVALGRMDRLLKKWVQAEGLWSFPPCYVKVQSGMMIGKCEEHVLSTAVFDVVSTLLLLCSKTTTNKKKIIKKAKTKQQQQYKGIVYVSRNQRETTHRFTLYSNQHVVEVILQRVAVLNSNGMGRVSCDGYEISASKKRCSASRSSRSQT